jgi:F-type H+-transporting ATPase subunit alpha
MKKVASSVKLELAQYRELASFSQFASDLDKDTKDRLDHGQILMEILKQPQYEPIPVENQVMIIYAAINRYLADVGVHNVRDFEAGFYEFMGTQYPEVGAAIRESGQLSAESETKLKEAIEVYRTQFLKDLGFTGAAEIE